MFRLRSLELQNFGPFKGVQRVEFPREDGVVMVYGENMRGKTTLLNAIRFGFFGKFVGRGSKEIPLSKVGNWEAAEAGIYGFEVKLDMIYEGVPYRLTRSCTTRPAITQPVEDEDFVVDYYLERDGVILGPNDATRELERILPEQISRFFLFDGELLQEYEELLLDESTAGDKIAAAIERVLGMPVLTRSRTTLAATREVAAKEQAQAAQGDQKTSQLGVMLFDLLAKSEVFTNDVRRLDSDLSGLRQQKSVLEEQMRKSERMRSILERKEVLEGEVEELKAGLLDRQSALQSAMSRAWSVVLRGRMKDTLSGLRDRQRELQGVVARHQLMQDLAARHLEVCPTCGQGVEGSALIHLEQLLKQDGHTGDARGMSAHLSEVGRQVATLERQIEAGGPETLRMLVDHVETTTRAIHAKREEIKDLGVELASVDEDGVRQLRHDHETVIKEIKTVEDGLRQTREEIAGNEASRDTIQAKLAKFSGSSAAATRSFFDLNNDLYDLFDEAIALYRNRLRHRVQEDATKHFRSLTTEQEYAGLRINDSYGLSIVHDNGSEIPLRSAGAEHIVALALIAALQNNAPLRGPIVIDSALVRLDAGHKERIMKALPAFASQVIILVYEDEMSPARARHALAGAIKAEFELKRVSARHTQLLEKVDV